jgi:hypothetical protein
MFRGELDGLFGEGISRRSAWGFGGGTSRDERHNRNQAICPALFSLYPPLLPIQPRMPTVHHRSLNLPTPATCR